jgi:hypothetical protein
MYHAPPYIWLLTILEVVTFPLATSVVLYAGALRAGLARGTAALIGIASAAIFASWFTASGVLAGHGEYHARLGHGAPLLPIVVFSFIGLLLALTRIPNVARTLAAPGMAARLIHPHSFRVGGLVFLLLMIQGHLPALFAVPAGLGDIAVGIAAPGVARKLAEGTGRAAALRFNLLGLTDLVVALIMGAIVGYRVIAVTPSGAPISELPLALIPSAAVPLLFALHLVSISALRRSVPAARELSRLALTAEGCR